MLSNDIGVSGPAPTGSDEVGTTAVDAHPVAADTWGSLRQFMRLTGTDEVDGYYWIITVHRPAHRVGHPKLNMDGCPGCTFERAVNA